MILNDLAAPKENFSKDKLDAILAELCGLVIEGQKENPDFYGMVAAAVLDSRGYFVTGTNYLYGTERVHAERAAIDKYEEAYGELPKGSIVITTLSPCCHDTDDNRQGSSCTDLLNEKHVKLAYCGYSDPTQKSEHNDFTVIITSNSKLNELCKKFADTFLQENFADGKGPGRPGDSQRHGIPKGATMAQLEKASHAKGRKGQLARWQLNMRRGKKKH